MYHSYQYDEQPFIQTKEIQQQIENKKYWSHYHCLNLERIIKGLHVKTYTHDSSIKDKIDKFNPDNTLLYVKLLEYVTPNIGRFDHVHVLSMLKILELVMGWYAKNKDEIICTHTVENTVYTLTLRNLMEMDKQQRDKLSFYIRSLSNNVFFFWYIEQLNSVFEWSSFIEYESLKSAIFLMIFRDLTYTASI